MELPSNYTEILRSVSAMGRELNLSRAAEVSGIARPTLRRHITAFRELCGGAVFELEGQAYRLTALGRDLLPHIDDLLMQSERLVTGKGFRRDGLIHASIELPGGAFHTQQHALNEVWTTGAKGLELGMDCWFGARGRLEAAAIAPVRDRLIVLRRSREDWLCVEVGEDSAMARWLGWEWAKSAVGKPIAQNPISNEANRLLMDPLDHVELFGGVWYDHVSALFRRPGTATNEPVNYQRLVMHCTFPDGSPAVATLVETTNQIRIEGIDPASIGAEPIDARAS